MRSASDDSANSHIVVGWLGHASVSITVGATKLLFDPVVRRRLVHLTRRSWVDPATYSDVDAVLLSHAHHDHLDLASLRRVRQRSPHANWHAPRGAATVLERAGFDPVVRRLIDDDLHVGPLRVRSVPAAHGGERLRGRGSEAGSEAVGYVVELPSGVRIWFAGDTAYDDVLERVGKVDIALVPVGGWWRTLGPGHMDAEAAARAVELVGARVAIPIHWGTYYPIGLYRAMRPIWNDPADEFVRRVTGGVDVRVLQPGGRATIELR